MPSSVTTRHLALLRGVNVGGHRRLIMADLRQAFASLGFRNVSTYIQTGNVFFETDDARPDELVATIQKRLLVEFGHEIAVILRDAATMARVVRDHPFSAAELTDDYRRYVTFLASEPARERVADLVGRQTEFERFHVRHREVYAAARKDAPRSGAGVPIERVLKMAGTARNWSVVQKLNELLAENGSARTPPAATR
jgi:uncharacterized protein (DUF1697 family)